MIKDVIEKKVKIIFNSKMISIFLVLFILGFLFISGPASAFIVGIVVSDKIVQKGEKVSYNISIDAEDGEKPKDIDYINFKIIGPNGLKRDFNCKFFINGTEEEGCRGITIQLDSINQGYGYNDCNINGYGYSYNSKCKLIYTIIVDTSKYIAGEYETSLVIVAKEKEFSHSGENLIISINNTSLKRCSIRAFDGSLDLINKNFSNNRLNFYISSKNNKENIGGQGSLTGQKGRDRFSYNFDVINILENDKNHAVILVSGKYKLGKGEKIDEKALLQFDKITSRIVVLGEHINIKTMIVNFRKDC